MFHFKLENLGFHGENGEPIPRGSQGNFHSPFPEEKKISPRDYLFPEDPENTF